MFVLKLGLIKPGQAYVCPQLWAFCMEILLWLILYFWETSHQLYPLVWAFSELLAFIRYLTAFSVGQEGHISQRLTFCFLSEDQLSERNILWFSSSNSDNNSDSDKIVVGLRQVRFVQR